MDAALPGGVSRWPFTYPRPLLSFVAWSRRPPQAAGGPFWKIDAAGLPGGVSSRPSTHDRSFPFVVWSRRPPQGGDDGEKEKMGGALVDASVSNYRASR